MKQVYIVDARISAARIKAVPATNHRTVVHTNTLEKLELFLAEPDRQFEPMKPGLTEGVQEFKNKTPPSSPKPPPGMRLIGHNPPPRASSCGQA